MVDGRGRKLTKGSLASKGVSIRSEFGLKKIDRKAVYLGLPMFIGRSKNASFQYLVDQVRDMVKGWKAKSLSFAGRSTRIKAVTSAIPSYAMAHVALPETTCLIWMLATKNSVGAMIEEKERVVFESVEYANLKERAGSV